MTDNVPIRHVIEVYNHKENTILCACGWFGDAASDKAPFPIGDNWYNHKKEMRKILELSKKATELVPQN